MADVVSDTPDGRFAYDAVNDNCSPAMGRDVSGPTACINSVANLDQKNAKDGCLFNLRFDPRSIQGEKAREAGLTQETFETPPDEVLEAHRETFKAAGLDPIVMGHEE